MYHVMQKQALMRLGLSTQQCTIFFGTCCWWRKVAGWSMAPSIGVFTIPEKNPITTHPGTTRNVEFPESLFFHMHGTRGLVISLFGLCFNTAFLWNSEYSYIDMTTYRDQSICFSMARLSYILWARSWLLPQHWKVKHNCVERWNISAN